MHRNLRIPIGAALLLSGGLALAFSDPGRKVSSSRCANQFLTR